ncbi:MAG TPA: glycosyltransferase family 9 protein [Ignavibacteria bacterium]|nr:glycosyltransferase family 9 protein [Ignavibacteria bacterium]
MKRILIIRTDRVGDVVMITPMIREIRKTFPGSFIATLTNPNTADILLNNPHLDLILTDDLKKSSFRKVVKEIRKNKFTDGLLVLPTERAAYQMFLAGIKNRIGVGKKLYEVITFMKSVSRNKYVPLRHESDYCMDLARAIGVKTGDLIPEIFITDEERAYGKDILNKLSVNDKDFKIIVHTGSGKSSGNWSEEKYLKLIREILLKKEHSKIILTAREMSNTFKESILSQNESRIVFADNQIRRLRDLICIIAQTDLLIAASTGPLHLASALDKKTIGLFCHRRMNCAELWGAKGRKAVNIEISSEYCDSCCSADKEICRFEEGIKTEDVLKFV